LFSSFSAATNAISIFTSAILGPPSLEFSLSSDSKEHDLQTERLTACY
jgi:hypothetical protein